jgi:hypothetical protein
MRGDGKLVLVGNGASRKGIDLHWLKARCQVWGCNYIYTEGFYPDRLYATSSGVLRNLVKDQVAAQCPVHIPSFHFNTQWHEMGGFVLERAEGKSSGCQALWTACQETQWREIYLIGFDLYVDNLSPVPHHIHGNAGGYDRKAVGKWVAQMEKLMGTHFWKQFYRVDRKTIPEFLGLSNLTHISRNVFLDQVEEVCLAGR